MNNKSAPSRLIYLPLGIILITAILLAGMLLSGGMRKIAAWYLLQLLLPATGVIGLLFTLTRWVIRRRFEKWTGMLSLLALLPALMLVYPLPFPASLAHTTPAVTVRLPANAPLKVLWGGDTQAVNYHVIAPDQRWAYDLAVAPYLSGGASLTDYGCFGVPVVAPESGVITLAHDGEPDMPPGQPSNNFTTPSGNHIVIQLDETGTYLEIAHLQQGSVTVTTGQRVAEGQVIGQCGNSGNTSEPHIHIHHQRQNPAEYPLNFAEGLPLYFRDHDGPPMPEGGLEFIDGVITALGDTVTPQNIP